MPIGGANDLAASSIDLKSIMHSGGGTDPKMPRYYTREGAGIRHGPPDESQEGKRQICVSQPA
jgi:hypothetical protein